MLNFITCHDVIETSKSAQKLPDGGKVWASDRMLLGAGVLLSQALHEIMSRSFTQHPVNLDRATCGVSEHL